MQLVHRNDKRNQRRLLQARTEAEQSIIELHRVKPVPNQEANDLNYRRNTSQPRKKATSAATNVR